jgi:hypothetical protein
MANELRILAARVFLAAAKSGIELIRGEQSTGFGLSIKIECGGLAERNEILLAEFF